MIIDIGLLTSKDILMKGCGMKVESPVKHFDRLSMLGCVGLRRTCSEQPDMLLNNELKMIAPKNYLIITML
jgi:hypothetical protein